MEPELLTKLLATAPTTAYRKGEVYKRGQGREARGRTGLWLLSSESRVTGVDLANHLQYLLDVLFPGNSGARAACLRKLVAEEQLDADVSCFWYGEAGARPPEIPPEVRQAIISLPAKFETDFQTD